MALLPPGFLDMVVAIGALNEDGGTVVANATGTLVGWPVHKNEEGEQLYRVFLVTNRHVVEDRDLFFVRFNQGVNSKWYQVDLKDENGDALWHRHSDAQCDLAAVSLNPEALKAEGAEFGFFSSDKIWAYQAEMEATGIAAGDGVFVLGFPLGLAGTEKSYVIVRGGTLVAMG